ncbi:MAG: polysaccharide biosynthesis tyrosine autokinase [Deltaproteobacteria bacterium]|nr:polysaccharide biosynthesis tyrosine autokinase [Deltaproteobacteria bacterium]
MKSIDTSQYELDLRDYGIILLKRKRLIVMTTLLIALLSFFFAVTKPAIYEATSSVKIEQSRTVAGLFLETLSWNSWDNIASESEVIKSTPVVARACKVLGLIPQDLTLKEIQASDRYLGVLRKVQRQIRTEQEGDTNIINVIVSSDDAEQSKRIANALVEEYRSYHVYRRTDEARRTREFIQNQLLDTRRKLRTAEGYLRDFKEKNKVVSLDGEVRMTLDKLETVGTQLETVKRKTDETERMIKRLEKLSIATLGDMLSDRPYIETGNSILAQLNSKLVDLILNRNNLLIDYTTEHPQVKALDEKIMDVKREMLRELRNQYEVYSQREKLLKEQVAAVQERNKTLPEYEIELSRLQRNVKVNEELYSLLQTKLQEAQIREKEHSDEVTVIRSADRGVRINDKLWSTTFVGLIIGLMIGLVLALVRETLDTSIGTIEDVERYLQIPVLGVIPHIDVNEIKETLLKNKDKETRLEDLFGSHAHLITQLKPKSSVAESYRTLRTNIQFTNLKKKGQVILFTSSSLKEGKSTTVANLAITKAQEGNKVLLVNCDLRKPSIFKIFGVTKDPGMTDVILGKTPWREAVKDISDLMMGKIHMDDIMRTPGLENLHILTCGGIPPNPAELLSSRGMTDFMKEARKEYDIVLMDCPPILPVTDAAILAPQVDGVVLVYQAGRIPRNALKRAKTHLENVRANVLGIVLNDITAEISGYYPLSQYQTKYYGEESKAKDRKKAWLESLEKSLQRARLKVMKSHVSLFQFFLLTISALLILMGMFWQQS